MGSQCGRSDRPLRRQARPSRLEDSGLRRARADRALITQQAIEIRTLAPLEDPGVRQSEPAIAQNKTAQAKSARWTHFRIRLSRSIRLQASFCALVVKPWFAAGREIAGTCAHGQSARPFPRATTRMAR